MKLSTSTFLITIAFVCVAGVVAQAQEHQAGPAPAPQTKRSSVQLGNKTIFIPDPDGFEEATSQFPTYKDRVIATEGADNDPLLSHLLVSDCAMLRKGLIPTYSQYTKVSVLKTARELVVDRTMMAGAVDNYRKNAGTYLDPKGPHMKQLLSKAAQGLSEVDSKETKIDFSQPQHLGEFDVRPDVNSFLVMMTVKVNSGGVEASVPMMVTLSFVRVNDRILYVYVFKKYQAETDIDAVKQFTTKWTNSILAAN